VAHPPSIVASTAIIYTLSISFSQMLPTPVGSTYGAATTSCLPAGTVR
jgi:hypothetical protein